MYPPNSLRWEKMSLREKNGCWFCNVAETRSVVRQKAQLLLSFLLYSINVLLTICKCTWIQRWKLKTAVLFFCFVFKNCQIKEFFCKVYKDPESFCFWVQTFCHRAFLKGSQHMDGNSLTWLLLGISGSPERELGFLLFSPHMRFPSLYPPWALTMFPICGQRARKLILTAPGPDSGPPQRQHSWNEWNDTRILEGQYIYEAGSESWNDMSQVTQLMCSWAGIRTQNLVLSGRERQG